MRKNGDFGNSKDLLRKWILAELYLLLNKKLNFLLKQMWVWMFTKIQRDELNSIGR